MSTPLILVTDDESDILELIRINLELDGYRVLTASSAIECQKALSDCKPDLAVLDIMLKDGSGLEICQKLKSSDSTSHIPVLLLTALSEDSGRCLWSRNRCR